ncbi:MAG: glutamine synthetase family protein [Hyphomicrobium sp.]
MTQPPDRALLREEANRFLSENPDIQQVYLIYTDLVGVQRGKLLTRAELLPAWENGRFMACSAMSMDVTGRDVEETGMIWETGDADHTLWPVPGTLKRIPWGRIPQAQYLGSFHQLDGEGAMAEPRHALQRIVDRFADFALKPVAAVELEFYLLDRESALAGKPQPPKGLTVPERQRHFQGYYLQDLEDFAPFFNDLYSAAEAQKLPLEALLSEYSPGQMEIGLKYRTDALQACDEAIQFKRLVKAIAEQHGLIASFMAKPYSAWAGCGMHLHISLADTDGRNVFASDEVIANDLLRHAIGGMKATMADGMAIFAPNANSYRRFRKASYAPIAPNWGFNNRSVSLRIPAGKGPARHVEHRASGADANPYLAMAAALAGVHLGLKNKIDPGPMIEGNGYEQPSDPMPTNWFAALETFRKSSFAAQYFGSDFVRIFATIKEIEADRFFAEPQPLDFDFYLRTI